MCRKKPTARSGRAARSIAGTSISWKSCTQTRVRGPQARSAAAAKRRLTDTYCSHAPSLTLSRPTK